MTSHQEPAPGSKSAKFIAANPLDPIVTPFEQLGLNDDEKDVQRTLAENVNQRLTKAMDELKEKHRKGTNEVDDPDRAPTGPAYQMISQQKQIAAREMEYKKRVEEETKRKELERVQEVREQVRKQIQGSDENDGGNDSDGDDGSDYDYLLEDDHDDPVLDDIRQRRLAEIRQEQMKHAENIAKGHGQYRTITQDEFLPECTGSSEWVVVHFFHKEFQRCEIMDHHLNNGVAPLHTTCKFLRIDAEKAPFFVSKLNIRTLPTLIVFHEGKEVQRLTGFEGLVSSSTTTNNNNNNQKDPDKWETSALQEWLASTGAIEYTRTATSEEVRREMERLGIRGAQGSIYRGGIAEYNDDDDDD